MYVCTSRLTRVLPVIALGLALLPLFAIAQERPAVGSGASATEGTRGDKKLVVYIGTYTSGSKSKGIYRLDYDSETGKLGAPVLVAETTDPSFLAIHPGGKYVYACNEINEFGGKKNDGSLSAFAIDAKTGALKLLNQKSSGGGVPCHVVCDAAGKHLLAANYTGGSACVYEIMGDGSLGERTGFAQHEGAAKVDPNRQEKPHAHSINLDKANKFAFVADLGLDKVLIYKFSGKGDLTANEPGFVAVPAGGGPRHFAFHPNGKFAYTNNELSSSVTAMSYDAAKGELSVLQTISTLPKGGFKGNSTAEVQVHPTGKFLYCSNRGHNSIAMFTIDASTGQLTAIGQQGKDIKTPRNFGIDPAGKHLIVANQDSDSLVVFRIDQKTGALESTGTKVEVPRPVCVKFHAAGN